MSFLSRLFPMPDPVAVMRIAARRLALACLVLSPCLVHAGPWGEVDRFGPDLADQPDPGTDVRFGHAVAVDGDWMIAGAPNRERPNGTKAGAVFIYKRQAAGGWRLHQRILFSSDHGECGTSVAMRGRFAVVGCRGIPSQGSTTQVAC